MRNFRKSVVTHNYTFYVAEADSDGDYSFEFKNQNGVNSNCLVTSDEGKYAFLVLTGAENAPNDMQAILYSFNMK